MINKIKDHIEWLAKHNNLTIKYTYIHPQWCGNEISIFRVNDYPAYAIALHEIGHALGTLQDKPMIESELGAWLWAKEHALLWTNNMQACMIECMASYYFLTKNDKRIKKSRAFVIYFNKAKKDLV